MPKPKKIHHNKTSFASITRAYQKKADALDREYQKMEMTKTQYIKKRAIIERWYGKKLNVG